MTYPHTPSFQTDPLVSVIVPVYNREKFIKDTIQSLVAQSFKDFEVLVVDDGSSDLTVSIVENFIHSYPQQFKIFTQENRGVSSARNLGISKARGKYIALLDSDDLWITNKLEVQVEYMEKHGWAICQTDEQWVRNGKKVNSMKKHTKRSGGIFFDSLAMCLVSPSATMLKKDLLLLTGNFDEKLQAVEDYDLWLRVLLFTPIHLIKEKLIIKNGGHADQLSAKFWGMDRFRVYSMLKLLHQYPSLLDDLKRNALYYYVFTKSKIISLGAIKRYNVFAFVKYYYYYVFYKFLWNIN